MDVVPVSVVRVSQGWDEQHLDATAAARQVGAAPNGGFTGAVSGPASRFTTTWERHVTTLAAEAEARAETLRRVIADYLATDGAAAQDMFVLATYAGGRL